MKHGNYFHEFAKYASLNVLGMLGLSCYILADTYFIAKGLGANGLAALNLALPIYSLLNGCGLMAGVGAGTKYSIQKGLGDHKEADAVFTNAVCITAVLALAFVTAGLFFSAGVVRLLGADAEVFEMTRVYVRVILLFAPAFLMNNVLTCFVRNDGAPQLAMAAMLAGSFSNIVLDYIFIFPLGMGIFGAVLATGCAPAIGMLVLSLHFVRKNNQFHLARWKWRKQLVGGIFSGGFPSLVTELSGGIVILVFNFIILRLQGNVGVAAYGVVANLSAVVVSIYSGIAQGIQPILSRSCGVGDRSGVQTIFRYGIITVLALSAVIYTGVFFGAHWIAAAFNSGGDALLQSIAENGLRLYFTVCPFVGFNIVLSVYFTSTEHPLPAHLIALMRGFVVMIPMAFFLSAAAGLTGMWCAFPATEFFVSIPAALLFLRHRRNLRSMPVNAGSTWA